jgi:hypothetical protein
MESVDAAGARLRLPLLALVIVGVRSDPDLRTVAPAFGAFDERAWARAEAVCPVRFPLRHLVALARPLEDPSAAADRGRGSASGRRAT